MIACTQREDREWQYQKIIAGGLVCKAVSCYTIYVYKMHVLSGTTWLQEIVYLISTDYDYDKARATIVVDRFPYLEFPYPGLRVVAEKPSPRFIKSHLPFSLLPKQLEEKKPKVIIFTGVAFGLWHNH